MRKFLKRIVYILLAAVARVVARFQLKIDMSGRPLNIKGPAIVLANHQSNVDWLVTFYALGRTAAHFIVGKYHFRNPVKARLFTLFGCIPKEQFYPDLHTIKMIYKTIRENGVIVLFPSGQSSYSGESTLIPFETAKLLKKLAAPVYYLHIDGAHLAFPKWDMAKIRAHRISVTTGMAFSVDGLASEAPIEIYERICQLLHYDDYEWQREHRVSAKGNRSLQGLEYTLYLCPACGAEFQMTAVGEALSCGRCGHSVRMDSFGFLTTNATALEPASAGTPLFDTPTQWYRWQFREAAKMLREKPDYVFTTEARLSIAASNGKRIESHEGMISFSQGILEFYAEGSAEPLLRDDVRLEPMLFQHESKLWFEHIIQNRIYRFEPKPVGAATKLVILKELYYLFERRKAARDPEMIALYDRLIDRTMSASGQVAGQATGQVAGQETGCEAGLETRAGARGE